MKELIELVLSYASIWLPSLVAVLGIVATIVTAIGKIKAAMEEFKNDSTLKNLGNDVQKVVNENKELKQQLDIVIDELKKVEDYRKELNKR